MCRPTETIQESLEACAATARERMVSRLASCPSGLAAMAAALRTAGWTVAEPGAETRLIPRHTDDAIVAERWVRAEEPTR